MTKDERRATVHRGARPAPYSGHDARTVEKIREARKQLDKAYDVAVSYGVQDADKKSIYLDRDTQRAHQNYQSRMAQLEALKSSSVTHGSQNRTPSPQYGQESSRRQGYGG